MADNNLSKNIKIGIDVELNKRSVDEVTRQIAALSKDSITLMKTVQLAGPSGPSGQWKPSTVRLPGEKINGQQFADKLFEAFFKGPSKVTAKKLIDELPTKELKIAAGQLVETFKEAKEQLRDVGQQIKYDQGSARYVQAPLGQGRPVKFDTYNGKTVASADFDKLVTAVKELRGKESYYTGAGSAARGSMQIEGIRQLVLQEINQIVGGSANAGVKVSGLAKYISPSQASLTRIEESEAGLTAVINDVGDDLEGLSDEVRAVISALNIDAGNLAKILGIRVAPTKIDPRAAFGEFDNVQVEDLRSFYKGLKGGQIAGQRFNAQDFADFAPGKDGSILVSPALLEMAFQRVFEKIVPGTRQPGADIVESKTAEALSRIAPILDRINDRLFDENVNNANSGRIWGSPSSIYRPGGSWVDTKVYQGPTGPNGKYPLPQSQGMITGGWAEQGPQPYGADSMRKWTKFTTENEDAVKAFAQQLHNDIIQGAVEAAIDAEEKAINDLGGEDWSDDDIQHGVVYIIDQINNAVADYERQLGLNYGTIFDNITSTPDPTIRAAAMRNFLDAQPDGTKIGGKLGPVLGGVYRDSVTGQDTSLDTNVAVTSMQLPAERNPFSVAEIKAMETEIASYVSALTKLRDTIEELKIPEFDESGWGSVDIAQIERLQKRSGEIAEALDKVERKLASGGTLLPSREVIGYAQNPENFISEQVKSRPEFLKQAKITTGIQDLMMQVMAMVPEQIAQATEPAVAAAVQQVEASDPFAAIFAKYEGLGLSTVIAKLRDLLAQSGGDSAKLLAGMDSEFANGLLTPITELSIKVQDEFGKVVDLLDFFHIPAGLDTTGKPIDTAVIDAMLERQGAGPQSTKDIAARAAQLGFDQSKLGSSGIAEGEAKANLELYQKKIKATLAIISLIDELGITLVGSNVVSADFSKLAQSADNLNKVAGEFGLEPTKITKDVQNIVDVYKVLEKLQKSSSSSPELQAILAKAVQGTGLKLAEIIAKIVENYPGALQGIEMDGSKVAKIGGLPPHFAAADATGSMAMHAFLRDLSPAYGSMASSPANWASQASYGHGASLMPYSKNTRHKYASAFGNIQPELTFDAGARAAAAESIAASSVVADAQEKQAVQTEQTSASIEEQTLRAIQSTKVYKEYAKTILIATDAINKINNALKSGENLSRDEKATLLKERANLATQAYDAKTKIEKLTAEALNATTNEAYLKELRRAPYDTLATQQLTGGGSVVRNLDRQVVTVKDVSGEDKSYAVGGGVGGGFGGAGRPPGGDGYITERGGEFLGPDPKATRDASEQIKRQLKDQVEASKEAEKANKSLISTWISGRYALYDVGNSFQNVSQQAFNFTKQIFRLTDSYRNYETAFTSVDRAMQLLGDETQGMAAMFVQLSETMPISFEQLTAIGTLGAQMGVTADGIKNFTEVVAKFSSVTGISAETTAQKFGRIAELANVDYSQFENLGSAIAYAGVNAVATESEILALTESIAAVSEQAGFAPDEIVGLSTAIASLGIAPEQARGVFTRVFADINRAVSRGGSELENFAKVSGMSSSEFASTWADSDGGAARAFRAMLAGLKTTGNMTQAFDDLNITETREVNTLTRLAENLNVVDSSMQDANSAFEDGVFLGDSFEKTVDNLDSKIQVFQNNFKSAMQSVALGVSQGFGVVLDVGSKVLEFMKRMADNSVILGPAITGIFASTGIVSAGAGVISVITKVLAQIYALRVAMINTANDPNMVQGFSKNLKALTNFGAALVEDHTGLTVLNNKMGELTQVTYSASSAFAKLKGDSSKLFSELLGKDIYMSTGSGIAEARGVDLKSMPEVKRTELARLEAKGVAQVVEQRKRLLQVMEDSLSWDSANAAKSAATLEAARAEQIYIYTTTEGVKAVDLDTQMKLKNATAAEIEASAELQAARANIANANANKAGAAAINTQTRAQSVASKGALGFGAAISAALGPISVIITVLSLLAMAYEAIATAIEEANTVHLFEDQGGTAAIREAIYKDTQAWKENGEAIVTVQSAVVNARKEVPGYKTALEAAAKGQEALKSSTEDTTDTINEQTLAIGQNTKELLAKALYENEELQTAFARYPDIFGVIEDAGVNVSTLLEDMLNPEVSEEELLARLENIKNYAASDVDAYKNALDVLKQAIKDAKASVDDAISQSKLVKALETILDIGDGTNDFTDGVAADVRTVLDYANDLAGVFDRIQQISVERLTARDGIVSGWRNIREAANSAKDAVKAANQEIADLSSDQAMLQYQYDVAKRYGDERRMAILQAKMTANQTKLTDATKKRNEAEDQASMTLVGSSKAAIANRATVNGMVDTYQNYVLALVRVGVKGKDLQDAVTAAKESFIKNGEGVGFSRDQLDKYVGVFDNFLTAVKKTPRNVTIEFIAEMSAAENALREFLAKANSSTATIKLKAGDGLGELPAGGDGGDGGVVDPSVVPEKIKKIDLSPASSKSLSGEAQKSFSSFKTAFNVLQKDFNGITDEASANKAFGGNKAKFDAWQEAFAKFKFAETGAKSWGLKTEDIKYDLSNNKNIKYSGLYAPDGGSFAGTESGKAIIDALRESLPDPLIEAINFLKNRDTFYNSDKSIWEATKGPYAKAKEAMGLDKETTWDWILKNKKGETRLLNGKKVNIIDYIYENGRKQFAEAWNNIKSNAQLGANYRSMIVKSGYGKSELQPFFGGDVDWWAQRNNDLGKAFHPDRVKYATGGYVSGEGSNVSDSIPAVLSNGEYVVRANAVKAIGTGTLDKINNADRSPLKFSNGGGTGDRQAGISFDIGADSEYYKPEEAFKVAQKSFQKITAQLRKMFDGLESWKIKFSQGINGSYYDPISGNMAFDPYQFKFLKGAKGDANIDFILGHELGHAVNEIIFQGKRISASKTKATPTGTFNESSSDVIWNGVKKVKQLYETPFAKWGMSKKGSVLDVDDPDLFTYHSLKEEVRADAWGAALQRLMGVPYTLDSTASSMGKSGKLNVWDPTYMSAQAKAALKNLYLSSNPFSANALENYRSEHEAAAVNGGYLPHPTNDQRDLARNMGYAHPASFFKLMGVKGNFAYKKSSKDSSVPDWTDSSQKDKGDYSRSNYLMDKEKMYLGLSSLYKSAPSNVKKDTKSWAVSNLSKFADGGLVQAFKNGGTPRPMPIKPKPIDPGFFEKFFSKGINNSTSLLENVTKTLQPYDDLDLSQGKRIASNKEIRKIAGIGRGGSSSMPAYGWSGSNIQTRVGRADGGMIFGPGGPRDDMIPINASNGEFVMNAKATSAYGADFMNALNQQRVTFAQPQTLAQNGNNSPTMVYLSPEDRALLRAAVERPVELYTENTKIAQSANAGNVILAQRGMR